MCKLKNLWLWTNVYLFTLFRLKGVFILNIGNTVIHLDQALARMREYERMKIEAESTLDSEGCSSNFQGATAAKLEGMHICTYFA